MFVPDGYDESYGVLPQAVKDATSHRSLAARRLTTLLAELYSEQSVHVQSDMSELDVICRASVYAVLGSFKHLRSLLASWVDTNARAQTLYEVLLQTYLFAGFPIALEALAVLHDLCSMRGLSQHTGKAEEYTADTYHKRGVDLCSRVNGSVFDKLMLRINDVSPDMQSWMIIEAYGKTLSRPGLDELSRECAIVCILAALGRESQLYSHVRGAINLGATDEHITTCSNTILECAGPAAESLFLDVAQRVVISR
jgi:4-carboxymuconolactone decarboxylase